MPTPWERSELRPPREVKKHLSEQKSEDTQSGPKETIPQKEKSQHSENQENLTIAQPLEFFMNYV